MKRRKVFNAPIACRPSRWPTIVVLWLATTGFPTAAYSQQITPAADAPQPRTPQESQRCFQLPEGFSITCVASEPLVADPVAMDFDEYGRIYVCEIHGYNLEGYLDIEELNKSGELDTAVRRILARPETVAQAEENQYGTVKVLDDTDGDGRMDRSRVLADRLPPCYGVVAARGGVVVLCAPDIVYLADPDGDGRAEVQETIFTGFGVGELWTRISNPRWSTDNWIYGVSGVGSAGTITGPHLSKPVRIGSVCFRFKPDGSQIEPASGRSHGFGQAIDDWGNRFLCTNQQHALQVLPIPHRYLTRNPYVASPNLTLNISSYGHPARVFPTSRPDPWRQRRAEDPAWVRFYGEAEATANGYFTAASGQAIYQDQQFPREYWGNHFSVDNAQNLVHRCVLEPNGNRFVARRPSGDEQTEFLTSTEQWFRPVNLLTGPDGALYVVDMYRAIIEDYSAIPRYLQQLYHESLIAGGSRGRIWRIGSDNSAHVARASLASLPSEQLVGRLGDPGFFSRMTAQRLMIDRQDKSVKQRLNQLVRSGTTPQSRLHALYTLDGLGELSPDSLLVALADDHFGVRYHALQLSEEYFATHPDLERRAAAMTHDDHARVQLQLALSLGNSNRPECRRSVLDLAKNSGTDELLRAAVLSSTADSAGPLLVSLLTDATTPANANSIVQSLASVIAVRRDAGSIGRVVAILADPTLKSHQALRQACLDGLLDGLSRGDETAPAVAHIANDVARLLVQSDAEIRARAVQLAGRLKLHHLPEMSAVFSDAKQIAIDAAQPLQRRLDSIVLLAAAPFGEWYDITQTLLLAHQPLDVQLAAVRTLATVQDAQSAKLLLSNFTSHSPRVREAVLQAIFERQNRLPVLLSFMEQQLVPASSIDANHREQLFRSPVEQIAEQAKRLLSERGSSEDRQRVLDYYHDALTIERDAGRGKSVFDKQCAQCHKLGGEGHEVGPDLLAAKTRADETLLADVLDPSSQITVGYDNYSVLTVNGRIFSGVLAAETATSVALRREESAQDTILRRDIDEMRASSVSMMPENLEKEVSPQDLADLLGYLRQNLGPAEPPQVTLFDEDPSFADWLNEGGGTARVVAGDAYSGAHSLAITPLQRFSARLPEWQFRIVERPGLGEFRYLRFAWKQKSGQGTMLELADNGAWPAAEAPIRRYYGGQNTTSWKAVQVSETSPVQWTVVTRDLWADFGSFTLTGIAPTALGGEVLFDRIELMRSQPTDP